MRRVKLRGIRTAPRRALCLISMDSPLSLVPHAMARHRVFGALLLGALLLPLEARAQKAVSPAPVPAPVAPDPLPTAPDIGILLLAIDELPAPGGTLALPPAPTIGMPGAAVPGGIVPGAITPANPLAPAAPGGITPARFAPPAAPFWLAAAQRKKGKDKDDDLFKPEPDFGSRAAPPATTPAAPVSVPVLPAPTLPLPPQPMGRAYTSAVSLRRALLARGWRDVSLAAPGAMRLNDALVERRFNDALLENRLNARALQTVRLAFADIAAAGAAPSPEASARAAAAASRIGQALGYRAVVAYHVAAPALQNGAQSAAFSLFLTDSDRESGEPILFDETGPSEQVVGEVGSSTAAALLDKTLRAWPAGAPLERPNLATKHLALAKTRIAAGDTASAQDELNQAVALDPSRSEPLVLLGDLLAPADPTGAAAAYRRAVEIDARDGATLAKIAVTYANASIPDWPRSLDAGRRAIATGFDSVPLRVAMATAQYGRADLFRQAERPNKAEDAELDARIHLDRALELAPDDPFAVRLLSRRLVEGRRFKEATQTLDRIAPRYPNDVEIQTQYAAALSEQVGREEDAFVASGRVWKMSGLGRIDVTAAKYRTLAQGFDARLYNIGKSAVQLTTGVANAALPREDALIQLNKLKEDTAEAENAINILRPPASVGIEGVSARQFAATLMNQALEQQQIYLETGQSLARLRGSQLYTQAVAQLNAARAAR